MRSESEACEQVSCAAGATDQIHLFSQLESHCWDPKGGELCLTRAKPEETLVEARSRSDVQIDGKSWV